MKLIGKIFLSFLVVVLGIILLLQTPFAKELAKNTLITLAKDSGIELRVAKIDGIIPFEWTLKNVKCSYKGEEISADSLKFRLALLPLFQRELEVSYLKIQGGNYRGVPFLAMAKGKLGLAGNKTIKISNFLIEGDNLFVRLEGKINPDLSIRQGNFAFYLPDLSIFKHSIAQGSLMGMGHISKQTASLECFGENLFLGRIPLAYSFLAVDGIKNDDHWIGSGHLQSGHLDIPITTNCDFRFFPKGRELSFSDFRMKGPELSIEGAFNLRNLEGKLSAKCRDLKILRPLFPNSHIKGSLDSTFDFDSKHLDCLVDLKNFGIFETSGKSLRLKSTIDYLFNGALSIEAREVFFSQIKLSEISLQSTFNPESSPFEFALKGTWQDPLELKGAGSWQKQLSGLLCQLDTFDGFALKKSISLQAPFAIDWNTDHFKMSNLSMDVGYGHLLSMIELDKTSSVIKINAREFPLEFVPIFYKHFSLAGTSSFDIDLIARENNILGTCNIALERAHFLTEGLKEPYTTKGSLQLHLNGNRVQVYGDLKAKDKQFINLMGTFPIQLQHFPFRVAIDPDQVFAGQLIAEGKLEDLFNFINVGQHRIEGWVSTKLHGSKTFKDPALQGSFELQDGLYENYYTGTCLKQIFAKGTADNRMIRLDGLTASDGDKGSFTAQGQLDLSDQFPFSLTATIDDFNALSLDTLTGSCSGEVTLSGDRLGALAKGKLKVHNATFRIPEQIPTIFPELPIEFVNPPEKIVTNRSSPPTSYPVKLDLEIHVPKDGRVEGRGLNAELKGRVHLTGTHKKVTTQGKLQLVSGEYIFSGKVFKLTQGEVLFNDKSMRSAYISLSGNCDLPEVSVTAMLEGPLTSPKLSFHSSPQMPTSSLLAQILFNKDISEISAVQALQVAQTVISLSGNSGPDILEKIRKSIGIDRLTLITSENDPGKISLQIGKYLMRGVLLTLSQGAESRNVSVEVDLKKGIKFQAEYNEEQQGKFSLKWHHHY